MRQRRTSTILIKQRLNTIAYLQSPYHLSLGYQISIIHQRHKKMANYYLLQLVQVLQHMPCTGTLNK